jgi:pilus assembly protein CpaE
MPKRPEIAVADFAEPLGVEPFAVIPFDAQLFGTASNNGRMLAETDAANPIVASLSNIAHLVTGRGVMQGEAEIRFEGHAFETEEEVTLHRSDVTGQTDVRKKGNG